MTLTQTNARAPKILVIEDDPSQARLIGHWLRSGGYDIETAGNGSDGMRMLDSDRWDLVLSDVDMPGASGLAILDESKRRRPGVPAILMTAHPAVQMASAAIDRGVDGYLLKPLSKERLLQRVSEVMDRYRTAREDVPTVLAIGACPQDVELGCGGSLLAHRAAGHEVIILSLSWGERGGDPYTRRKEAQEAADRMGATLISGNLRDGAFDRSRVIELIERAVANHQPQIVYTHTEKDMNQANVLVHQAALIACQDVPRIYCFQTPTSTIRFEPKRFFGIDPFVDEKVGLLEGYRSQAHVRALEAEVVRSNAVYWSRFSSHAYVEAMEVIRESTDAVSTGSRPMTRITYRSAMA